MNHSHRLCIILTNWLKEFEETSFWRESTFLLHKLLTDLMKYLEKLKTIDISMTFPNLKNIYLIFQGISWLGERLFFIFPSATNH